MQYLLLKLTNIAASTSFSAFFLSDCFGDKKVIKKEKFLSQIEPREARAWNVSVLLRARFATISLEDLISLIFFLFVWLG